MLKIKDNIDLKELEKFGFRHHKSDDNAVITSKWGRIYVVGDRCDGYSNSGCYNFHPYIIILENRYIRTYNHWDFEKEINDTLFDLIQAGLIEKVGGKDE